MPIIGIENRCYSEIINLTDLQLKYDDAKSKTTFHMLKASGQKSVACHLQLLLQFAYTNSVLKHGKMHIYAS